MAILEPLTPNKEPFFKDMDSSCSKVESLLGWSPQLHSISTLLTVKMEPEKGH